MRRPPRQRTLFPLTNSWYFGSNVRGKSRSGMMYLGGGVGYRTALRGGCSQWLRGFRVVGLMFSTIITCAITGNHTSPSDTPHLPVTPEQIAHACFEAADAGASIVHVHVRDPRSGAPLHGG